MAVDIPELDNGEPGALRSRWFLLVMTDPAIFRVVILLAASHYSGRRYPRGNGPNLLELKSRALASINEAMQDTDHSTSDQIIGAVAKMASYEAMFGDQRSFEWHMEGLLRMVKLRGSLSALGPGGLLARICLWIDHNSAFLYNSPIHFSEAIEDFYNVQANPSGFLAEL